MTIETTTVGIIGLGPVGSILAAHLAESGVEVVIEDISEGLLTKIRKDGLRISGIRNISIQVDKVAGSLAELAKFDPDILFVTTKGCFLKNVLAELKPLHLRKAKVVSFQNGLDNERLIADTLGSETTYRVVVNYAGNMIAPGETKMNWFQPPNYVGALSNGKYRTDETTKHIADVMTKGGLRTEEVPDIKRYVWKKTILNSALCSICALTGQTMKEAMKFESSRDLAVQMLKEGLLVAEADGYDFGQDALNRFACYLDEGGAHKPSMLIDVENKRMTEVDFLSGAIVGYAEHYAIQTPANSVLTCLIKSLQDRYLRIHDQISM